MKQKWKQVMAWLLVMVMLVGMIPDTVYAAATTTEQIEQTTEAATESTEMDMEMVSEDVTQEVTTQVVEETSTEVTEEISTEVTEEKPDEATTEIVEESATQESVTESFEQPLTEENTETAMDVDTPRAFEEAPELVTDSSEEEETISEKLLIYHDGEWAASRYRWYVLVNGKKHYIFCLNHGLTMRFGMYYGAVTAGYSGKTAFKKAVALNYFYKTNGNSWGGSKDYGPVQEVIWDETGSSTAKQLTTYIENAWKVTSLNGSRGAGFSTNLKPIKQSEQSSKDARKKMIASLTAGKHVIDLSSTYDATTKTCEDTIKLGGSAWKYFNEGGYDGGSSDIVVDGIYDTNGIKVTDGSCSATLTSNGNLKVNITSTDEMGNLPETAYTVIMHINMDYQGASNINYLLTADGKQNLAFNADFNSPAYFAIRVYGRGDRESAKLYINKVDEFDNFVPGCTFQLTGVQGEALSCIPNSKTINSSAEYFKIESPGYYKLVETAVPSSDYLLDTTERYVFAKYNDKNQLLLYTAGKNADGTYTSSGDSSVDTGFNSGVSGNAGEGTASFTYKFINYYNSGSATLHKYGNLLVKYENGKFVYEKQDLENVGFRFYAAEDIYVGETLLISQDAEILHNTYWGKDNYGLGTGAGHRITIDGKLTVVNDLGNLSTYRGYTANNGKIRISDLPAGSYYCVETDLSHPGLVMSVGRYEFDIVAGEEREINGGSIVNEQAPADVYVYKQDNTSKVYLSGAEFTLYANVNNTNYAGEKLFNVSQTVNVVTARNLATGEETVESNTWVPIQSAVSNDNGLAMFENIPYGDYLIEETKSPEGYEAAENTIRFTHTLPDSAATEYSSGFVYQFDFGNLQTSHYTIYKKAEKAYLNTSEEKNVDAYIYKDEAIEGVVFGVYAAEEIKNTLGNVVYKEDDLVTTCTSDVEGIATFGGAMFVGKYYFKEIQTADDNIYKLDETRYDFEVTGTEKTKNLTDEAIINDQYKGSIKAIKTDGKTKVVLSDVEFNLLDAKKNVIGTYLTDANGEIYIKNLPIGTYYLQETKTKENYKLDDTLREVKISKENLNQEVSITNEKYKGSIKVIKTDGRTKKVLPGVEFELLDEAKNVIETYVTDANGEIFIEELELATYYIRETKTLKGYKLSDEVIEVTLTKEEANKIVKVKNYKNDTKITVKTDTTITGGGGVRTGDVAPIGLILALFLLSSIAFAYLAKKKDLKFALSTKGKKFMIAIAVVGGIGIFGALSVKAAAEMKDISTIELENAEYNGTVYEYALQKQYETTAPDEEVLFDEEIDGKKLVDVYYETLETVLQTKTLEETKEYKDILIKDESKIADTIEIDGNTYNLENVAWSEEPNMEIVSYTKDYGYQTEEPTPEPNFEYTYTSPVTKKDNTVTLPFVRMEKGNETWVDGFTATVTFHNLDGEYFTLGNHEFQYDSEKLSFTNADYTELVKKLGYDTSKYRLSSASWSGKAYKKNGVLCRDAIASGQQYAASYQAFYEDEVENGKIYTAKAAYVCEVEVPAEEATPTYVMRATGYYEKPEGISTVLLSIGVVIFVILIIAILYTLSRKKNKVSSSSTHANM